MSIKYHVSDSGKIVECKAGKTPCPKENFDSIQEAEQSLAQKYGTLSSVSTQNPVKQAEKYYGGQFITPYTINIPQGVEKALKDIEKIGNPLIVGGCVRDSFDRYENKDIDIEVHGTDIDTLAQRLREQKYIVDEVGKQFGVLKVQKKGVVKDLDISVPRKENRTGAGHRSFSVEMDKNMTVSEAAERRDFTFNAVMYDHERKVLVDPASGQQDFENKVMRHVSEKFAEDPLRVLRGFQFAGRFNMTFAPETIKMCQKLREEYKELSVERVQEEWGKFYNKSTNPNKGLQCLQDVQWDDTTPGLKNAIQQTLDNKSLQTLPEQPKNKKVIYGAAAISQYMNDNDRKTFLQSSVIGVKEQQEAETLATFDTNNAQTTYKRKVLAKKLQKHGFTFNDYANFAHMTNNKEGIILAQKAQDEGIGAGPEQDLVMGKDIMEHSSKKPGPWMGELLDTLRDKQYNNEFNNKDDALNYALSQIKE